jgi:enoyl-CoA hydratase/carnithine racemase
MSNHVHRRRSCLYFFQNNPSKSRRDCDVEPSSSQSAASVAAALTAISQGLDVTLDEGLKREAELFGALFETDSMREGVTAFIEKRPAKFRD